jgi:thiamine biosynthesis lipoprotein
MKRWRPRVCVTEVARASPRTIDRRQALALLASAVVCTPAAAGMRRASHFLFGSAVELLLPAATQHSVIDGVLRGLVAVHTRWNAWKPGEVSDLNRAFREGRSAVASPALRALIRQSAWLESRSLGCFNAGIGGLVNAWGFHDDVMQPGSRPGPSALAPWTSARPSLAQLEMRDGSVTSRNPQLQLDFGGVAKGAAIDAALDHLQAQGVNDVLLNLGGNLAAMGHGAAAGRQPWTVGIRDPAGPGLLATLQTDGREAVVTSGSYERYRMLDGERCSHILDPQFGAPAADIVSVTIVHRSATLADAAATALLVAGPARWRVVAERMGVDGVVVVDRHRRVSVTPKLAPRMKFSRGS